MESQEKTQSTPLTDRVNWFQLIQDANKPMIDDVNTSSLYDGDIQTEGRLLNVCEV